MATVRITIGYLQLVFLHKPQETPPMPLNQMYSSCYRFSYATLLFSKPIIYIHYDSILDLSTPYGVYIE